MTDPAPPKSPAPPPSGDSLDPAAAKTEEARLDAELEGTFPASDPPAITRPKRHAVKSTSDARARAERSARRAERAKS